MGAHSIWGLATMLRTILTFGLVAGVIIIVPMSLTVLNLDMGHGGYAMLVGYLTMILAFSLIFMGMKRHRDTAQGGVIRFGPALLLGLGITVTASIIYVIGWEIALAATHYSFVDSYGAAMLEAARAKGASPARLAQAAAEAQAFKVQYANPLYRLPITFIEVFPVGVVISLISAAVLRNSRILPARRPLAAA
jgi:hypothetical protein